LVYFTAVWYIYFVVIWYILWPIGIFSGHVAYGHLVYFFGFGTLYQEKSGNPARHAKDNMPIKSEPSGVCMYLSWE
jgi:hypothetical protein